MCGKPPVAIRRWGRDDGYDDSGLLPEEGVYGPACKLHANHDVVPLSEVLKAVADAGCWKHDPSLMPRYRAYGHTTRCASSLYATRPGCV